MNFDCLNCLVLAVVILFRDFFPANFYVQKTLKMSDVHVYVYDLSKGLARSMSQALLGRQIEGVWHTGIVAYGLEWFFGSQGISNCQPCGTILGQPDEKIFQGRTAVSYDDFYSYIMNLSRTTFKGSDYHLLKHNCNNFSDQVSEFLTGRKIPSHITGLPQEVLSTPFGQMLLPMLEQMSVNPGTTNGFNVERPSAPPPQNTSSSASSSNSNHNATSSTAAASANSSGKSVDIPVTLIETAACSLMNDITDGDEKALLKEIKEFCLLPGSSTVDWSLGRPHLHLLGRLASPASSTSAAACDLLAAMMNREELVAMTTRDPKKTLQTLTASCDSEHESIRVLANLTRHSTQRRWFLNAQEALIKDKSLTAFAALTRLLEELMERRLNDQHAQHFAVLCYNACLGLRDSSIAGENNDALSGFALEMTTPLLEFFMKLQTESLSAPMTSCVETLLEAMEILVDISSDAKDLSKCYGIETDKIQLLAPRSKVLAQRIFG